MTDSWSGSTSVFSPFHFYVLLSTIGLISGRHTGFVDLFVPIVSRSDCTYPNYASFALCQQCGYVRKKESNVLDSEKVRVYIFLPLPDHLRNYLLVSDLRKKHFPEHLHL